MAYIPTRTAVFVYAGEESAGFSSDV